MTKATEVLKSHSADVILIHPIMSSSPSSVRSGDPAAAMAVHQST